MVGLIRRSYRYLTADTFLPLYKSLVRIHFDYATSVWSPYLQKHIDLIEGVQRRATKQLPSLKDMERLKILELPTLAYRRERADMIEAYKITHGVYDIGLAPKLQMASARHLDRELRGHSYKLLKPRARRSARACECLLCSNGRHVEFSSGRSGIYKHQH